MKKLFLLSAGVVFFFASDMMADPRPSRPRSESTDSVSEQLSDSNTTNSNSNNNGSQSGLVTAVGVGSMTGGLGGIAACIGDFNWGFPGAVGGALGSYLLIRTARTEAFEQLDQGQYTGVANLSAGVTAIAVFAAYSMMKKAAEVAAAAAANNV